MKNLEFPIISTKVKGLSKEFNLSDVASRQEYFHAKVGPEIEAIKQYLTTNAFMAFFLGKKNAGKGTYSGLLKEIFGEEHIASVGLGDLVREVHGNWDEYSKTEEFKKLKQYYRGYISFDEAIERLHGRSQSSLLPSEFALALLKARIEKEGHKAVIVDGIPRDIDQISYSLFFRDLANYGDEPDLFTMIDIPMSVIDERIKYRVICPICKSSRNLKLFVTKEIEYEDGKFHLICDNSNHERTRMEPKEGDELGLEPIRARLEKDEEILKKVFELHGIPKVLLRNQVPVSEALTHYDEYELTPEYVLEQKEGKVTVSEKPWTIKDDNGVESYSLLAPPVTVTLIKQLADVLELV